MNNREKIQTIQRKSLSLFEENKILYNNDNDYIINLLNYIEDIKLNKNNNNENIIDKLYEMHNCIQKYILFNENLIVK
jgi:hypothetical protein